MSIEALRNEVIEVHGKMRKHVLNAKIKPEWYDRFLRNIDQWTEDRLLYVLESLRNIYVREWTEVEKIWTKPHINDEMWENYQWIFDGKDVLDEQKLLTAARKVLVRALRNFRRAYTEKFHGTKKTTPEQTT